jgi:hypothetical protein
VDQLSAIGSRSRVEIAEGVEQLVIRYRGSRVANVFLSLWMVLWTAGCAAGFYGLTLAPDEPALLIFLAFQVVSWLVVAAVTSWQLAGEEIIRVQGDRLIHAVRAPGWTRRHSYPVTEIRELSCDPDPRPYNRRPADNPPLSFGLTGVVKFTHAGRTVRMAKGQDESEGRAILAWLAPRLPASASATT